MSLDMAGRWVTENNRRFFEAEIANERHGGVDPATLSSAIDSLSQDPDMFDQQPSDLVALLVIRDNVPGMTTVRTVLTASEGKP